MKALADLIESRIKELENQVRAKLAALDTFYRNFDSSSRYTPLNDLLCACVNHIQVVRGTTKKFYLERFNSLLDNPKGALWMNIPSHFDLPYGVKPINKNQKNQKSSRNQPFSKSSNRAQNQNHNQGFPRSPAKTGPAGRGQKRPQGSPFKNQPNQKKPLTLDQRIERTVNRALQKILK